MEAKKENVTLPFHLDELFSLTMRKKWNEVLRAYESYPSARKAKLTKSEETALHLAVSSYHPDREDATELTELVQKLVDTFPEDEAVEILGMPNDKGNTPLHFAAALGNVDMCSFMASKDRTLLGKRNDNSETPFFLAAAHGKLEVFLWLQKVWEDGTEVEPADDSLFRRSDGCNILHAAIAGEHFELAHHIISKYQRLVDGKNVEGSSPLNILAMKPSVFESSSNLRRCDRIIYRCLLVPKLKLKDLGLLVCKPKVKDSGSKSYKYNSCPDNYETCMNLMRMSRKMIKIVVASIGTKNGRQNDKDHRKEKDEESQGPESSENNFRGRINKESLDNNETCVNLMRKSWAKFKTVVASIGKKNGGGNDKDHRKDEESQDAQGNNAGKSLENRILPDEYQDNEEDNREGSFPRNYTTCINLFKFAIHLMMVILGFGFSSIKKIREKKEKHTWAKQIMDKLIEHEKGYKYDDNGQSRGENLKLQYAEIFAPPPDMPSESEEQDNPSVKENNKSKTNEESDEYKPVEEDRCVLVAAKMKESQTKEKLHSVLPDTIEELLPQPSFVLFRYQKRKAPNIKKETSILIAAKMGITEMVEKILDTFPVAIQDVDEHEKNALLLAIENRQTKLYDLLMKKKLPEFVLYQVDDEGNSALHLAATFQQHQPWRIPGAALQMQWEIKWYKHVKHTMPSQYLVRYQKNKKGETARQIFTRTHEKLVKDGSDWLIKTSESCSVVAALIATVAFATSTTVPGGINNNTGDPVLEGQLAFDVFSIASLVALCFSITALVFFLAILTSRCQEQDFRQDLPQKLLFGLSSLFTSIAAMLLSFCSGHFFVLKEELHSSSFFIYALTCLPVTFFAFAQLPLYFDLLWSIIRKIPLRSYKVFNQ